MTGGERLACTELVGDVILGKKVNRISRYSACHEKTSISLGPLVLQVHREYGALPKRRTAMSCQRLLNDLKPFLSVNRPPTVNMPRISTLYRTRLCTIPRLSRTHEPHGAPPFHPDHNPPLVTRTRSGNTRPGTVL